LTVNITCSTYDGRNLCDSCRTAARSFAAAGHRVEHSSRYAALRAAAAGAYGFVACVVPVSPDESSIVDAAISLFGDRRLALVADDPVRIAKNRPSHVAVLPRPAYESGTFALDWLSRSPSIETSDHAEEPETLAMPRMTSESVDDRRHATRRLKRIADDSRDIIATAGLASAPRLDLLAVLDDEIAWARASDTAFGICLVHLPALSARRTGEPATEAERRIGDASSVVAGAVRSTDVISGRGDDFVVVLADADASGALRAAKRFSEAISTSVLRPRGKTKAARRGFAPWAVGCAVFPKDGSTRESLLARATASLKPI